MTPHSYHLPECLGCRYDGITFAQRDQKRTAIFLGDLINPKNDSVPSGTRETLNARRNHASWAQ